ncbi:hypothetical protein EZV62_003969 [Acer yangbiense]|uniref:Rx N-terminal domain-containing protein n=1 Tax=Acer yangbiense TaxID=1000413 RepID=A0A5C7IJE5_9ROSI|nr:hypothetical protein EZV62_003969 [Acer yangbiense]
MADAIVSVVLEQLISIIAKETNQQDFKKDDDDNIITCKMHDIIHDFARFLVKNECSMMVTSSDGESSLNCFNKNARHLTLILDDDSSFPTNIGSIFKLRSLLVRWNGKDSSSISNCLPSLFTQLTCLRALDSFEGQSEDLMAAGIIDLTKNMDFIESWVYAILKEQLPEVLL